MKKKLSKASKTLLILGACFLGISVFAVPAGLTFALYEKNQELKNGNDNLKVEIDNFVYPFKVQLNDRSLYGNTSGQRIYIVFFSSTWGNTVGQKDSNGTYLAKYTYVDCYWSPTDVTMDYTIKGISGDNTYNRAILVRYKPSNEIDLEAAKNALENQSVIDCGDDNLWTITKPINVSNRHNEDDYYRAYFKEGESDNDKGIYHLELNPYGTPQHGK